MKISGTVQKIRQNKILFCMLVIQMILLGCILFRTMTRERYEKTYLTPDMKLDFEDIESVELLETGCFQVNGEEEAIPWKINNISLPAGTYNIITCYRAKGTDSDETYVRIESESNQISKRCDMERHEDLTEGEISVVKPSDDIMISVVYGGKGLLSIESISIVERSRKCSFLIFLSVCLFFDVLYLIFFTKYVKVKDIRTFRLKVLCFLGIVFFSSMLMLADSVIAGHDLNFHLNRILGIADGLREGQFPVRIYTSGNHGYGYPSSVFYGDILLYAPALLYLLGFPLFRTYQIYVIAVNAATCLISYLCFKRVFRDVRIGMLGAFLYTCSAYRLIDIYIRAAVGEFTAMLVFPVLFYAAYYLVESGHGGRKHIWLWLSLGATGLIQTHILSTQMCMLFWLLFMIMCWKAILRREAVLTLLKAGVSTLVLNAWFLGPFLQYYMSGNYNINNLNAWGVSDMQTQRVYLYNIFSIAPLSGSMSLSIGLPLLLGLLVFLYLCVKYGRSEETIWKLGAVGAVFGTIAIWLSSVYFPWNQIVRLHEKIVNFFVSIQFPWRYLSIATLFLIVTALSAVWIVQKRNGERAAVALMCAMIAANILYVGRFYTDRLDAQGKQKADITRLGDVMWLDNLYLPAGTDIDFSEEPRVLHDENVRMQMLRDKGCLQVECTNVSDSIATVSFPLVYYPNYTARDENGILPIYGGENNRATIELPPRYEGHISIKFETPFLWKVYEGISLAGLIVLTIYGIYAIIPIDKILHYRHRAKGI